MFKIIIAGSIASEGIEVLKSASDVSCLQIDVEDHAELLHAIANTDALIIRGNLHVDAPLLEAAPRLKLIAFAGVRSDSVDVAAATEHGVMVMKKTESHSVAAAEYTLSLMLALARHLPQAFDRECWEDCEEESFAGDELHGKTLGIIGLGQVGRKVAALAQAFGMTVLANDPYITEDQFRDQRLLQADEDEVLSKSDYLSLHIPLTPETTGLMGRQAFAQMKEGARLISISHTAIIDLAALHDALKQGLVAGAALDVFNRQALMEHPLHNMPNVILTPHLSDNTIEAQRDIAVGVAHQVMDALREVDFRNVINLPFVPGVGYDRLRVYLEMGRRLGVFQAELAQGPLRHLEVECVGDLLKDQVRPMAVALLRGIMERMDTGNEVNYINAPVLAHEHGITLSQARGLITPDHPVMVICRAMGDGWEQLMAGAVFGGRDGRIVRLGRFRIELKPEGTILIMRCKDVPGLIGQVGMLLGKHQVNIAAMDYGRINNGGDALSLLTIDTPVNQKVLAELTAIEPVDHVQQISF